MRPFTYTTGIFLLLLVLSLNNCVRPQEYPLEPVIEFTGISKNSMLQQSLGNDSLLVFLNYTDGDGDLGGDDTLSLITMVDSRDGSEEVYALPYVEQQGAGNGISGDMIIKMKAPCCTYVVPNTNFKLSCDDVPITTDSFFVTLTITDRAGNVSNAVQTPTIYLICK